MSKSALLVMDIQNGIVEGFTPQSEQVLTVLKGAIPAARDAGLPVMYVRVAFRSGHPEISSRNSGFSSIAQSGGMLVDDHSTQIHESIAPQAADVVMVKKRLSAFSGSDLNLVLRAMDVDSLVLSGISTSAVVLSTFRQAADLDYRLTVLQDACADGDDEVHRVLMDKVFPRHGTVQSAEEWAVGLQP